MTDDERAAWLTPPPDLVRGCDSPEGVRILADWLDEHGGDGAVFREQTRDTGEMPFPGFGLGGDSHPSDLQGKGDGTGAGYGFPLPNSGNGFGYGYGYSDRYRSGEGFGRGDGFHDGDGDGCGQCYDFPYGLPNGDGGPDAPH